MGSRLFWKNEKPTFPTAPKLNVLNLFAQKTKNIDLVKSLFIRNVFILDNSEKNY